MTFALHPDLDIEAAKAAFVRNRRVRLTPFLCERDLERLCTHVAAREDWLTVINAGEKVYELDATARAALTPEAAAQLDAVVIDSARNQFQFRYATIRVDDVSRRADSLLDAFANFMSKGSAAAAIAEIVGADFDFADAQATRYGAGDFLLTHDDDVAGKGRMAAYVLSLTRDWHPEWGGLLLFHDDAVTCEAWLPSYNTLSLFAVPQAHSVSMVAPYSRGARTSVTGWLRRTSG